jgi:uncharacterized membrane protein
LLREALAQFLVAHGALQGRASQVIIFLVHRQLGAARPVSVLVFVLFLPFFEQVLISNRNRHLGLHLQQLVLHVEDHLLDHLLGLLGLVDQIV